MRKMVRARAAICRQRLPRVIGTLAVGLLLAACAASPDTPAEPPLKGFKPTSILVLPPLDDTFEVAASYAYLPTVTRPLAERGYYVFPVAVVERIMRDNGLSEPAQMHQVPLRKLGEIFGADAVLYLTLSKWGSSYKVIVSSTEVAVEAKLVDTKSGTEIWEGRASAADSSGSGNGKLAEMLIGALVRQVVAANIDNSPQVARQANYSLFNGWRKGLPVGPYHPDYGKKP